MVVIKGSSLYKRQLCKLRRSKSIISWDKYGEAPENPCLGNSVIRIMEEEAL